MKKNLISIVFFIAAALIVMLIVNINVDAYYLEEDNTSCIDYGDFDSYTDSKEGYSNYSIYMYDLDSNELFGQNANYSSFTCYNRTEKVINVYDDDPIVQFVPKSLFMKRGETVHIGEQYGFYVNSHPMQFEAIGAGSSEINEVDVLIFDLEIFSYNTEFTINVIPLYTYTYFYFSPYLAGLDERGHAGVKLNNPFGEHVSPEQYYINMQSEKAHEQGLVAPYPYCDFNPEYSSEEVYPCDREAAQINMEKYAITDVSTFVKAKNINLLNQGDDGYDESQDVGYAFYRSNLEYISKYHTDTENTEPEPLSDYIIGNLIDIYKTEFFNSLLDEIPYVSEIIDSYKFVKDVIEYQEMLDEYFQKMYTKQKTNFYIEYYTRQGDESGPVRNNDVTDENGLIKSLFYCFNTMDYIDEENIVLLPKQSGNGFDGKPTKYSHMLKTFYNGYFPKDQVMLNNEVYQNTLLYYSISIGISKLNVEENIYEYTCSGETKGTHQLGEKVYKTLDLEKLVNDTFDKGYFLEGYSDFIKFIPKETGVYYFNVNDLNITIKDINTTGELYIELEEGVTYDIQISGSADKYREYSFVVFKQTEFELLADPYLENAGTEVTLNNGEINSVNMHVGFTRNIFLGANAPIDLYSSRLDYEWSSSNNDIATVSQYGTVFAKKQGIVTISACISNRYVSEIILYIYNNDSNDGDKLLEIKLDISQDPNSPNGSMLTYTPTQLENEIGCNFGPEGFDIKPGYTRCIFIINGPSVYRRDYLFESDTGYVTISEYGTIYVNPNIGDTIFTATISCTYKYDYSYHCTFTLTIHHQDA